MKQGLSLRVSQHLALTPQLQQSIRLLQLSTLDVDEELDRLSAHVAEARSILTRPEPAGRRLDFLLQEFNREANTLCSKSSDIALTRVGLALKAVIDQFRASLTPTSWAPCFFSTPSVARVAVVGVSVSFCASAARVAKASTALCSANSASSAPTTSASCQARPRPAARIPPACRPRYGR